MDEGRSQLQVSNDTLYFLLCPSTLPWLIYINFLYPDQQPTIFVHAMPAAHRALCSWVLFARLSAVFMLQAGPTQRLLLGQQLPLPLGLGNQSSV